DSPRAWARFRTSARRPPQVHAAECRYPPPAFRRSIVAPEATGVRVSCERRSPSARRGRQLRGRHRFRRQCRWARPPRTREGRVVRSRTAAGLPRHPHHGKAPPRTGRPQPARRPATDRDAPDAPAHSTALPPRRRRRARLAVHPAGPVSPAIPPRPAGGPRQNRLRRYCRARTTRARAGGASAPGPPPPRPGRPPPSVAPPVCPPPSQADRPVPSRTVSEARGGMRVAWRSPNFETMRRMTVCYLAPLFRNTNMNPILSISGLTKTYASGFQALKGVSLDISAGEIFALLGPNGAGKTTLISIICGLVNPSGGTVTVDGHDIVRDYRQARALIGLVPQELTTDAFETV